MLSKKDLDLLYATAGLPLGTSTSAACEASSSGCSVNGDPAIASLAISSRLNLALDWAKSKSESGTSTFWPPGRPPRPRPRPAGVPLPALTLISLTLFVRLSIALPPLLPSCAIAAATAARAAFVASSTLLGAATTVALTFA